MRSGHILVVDDEPLICWSVRRGLAARGHRASEATSGVEALERCGRGTFDLALLDYRLPDMDGIELARRIRRAQPSCPVILMTAYGSPELGRQASMAGIHHVVDKPFDMRELVALVDGFLSRACSA